MKTNQAFYYKFGIFIVKKKKKFSELNYTEIDDVVFITLMQVVEDMK